MSTPSSSQRTSDRTTTIPVETMTTRQRDVFQQFLEARQKSHINLQEPISFARLLVDDKPGMIMAQLEIPQTIDYIPDITTQAVVEAFDVAYDQRNNGELAIAGSSGWLEGYTTNDDPSPECVGTFLGYPNRDIQHYISSDPPYTEPEDLVTEGVFDPEEVAYVTYLPQRNDDSVAGYKRAISEGKKIRETIAACAQRWNLPDLAEYAEWMFEKAVAEYDQCRS